MSRWYGRLPRKLLRRDGSEMRAALACSSA
jgi:hypothetical protein